MLLGLWLTRPEDLEVDLWVHSKINLMDMWRGAISVRRVALFASRLPPTSLCMGAVSREEIALLDVWGALVGEQHPRLASLLKEARPQGPSKTELLQRKAAEHEERKRRLSVVA